MSTGVVSQRSWSLPSFVAGCFAASIAWDIVYSVIANIVPPSMTYLPVPVAVFAIPIFICVGLGIWLGEWNATKSPIAQIGAAAWCAVVPALAYILLLVSAMLFSIVIKQPTLS